MARTNAGRLLPENSELIILRVQGKERISPTFIRVTFGSGDISKLNPRDFDQLFRLSSSRWRTRPS